MFGFRNRKEEQFKQEIRLVDKDLGDRIRNLHMAAERLDRRLDELSVRVSKLEKDSGFSDRDGMITLRDLEEIVRRMACHLNIEIKRTEFYDARFKVVPRKAIA